MKAIVFEKFGPPEVLHLKDVPKPTPKENEVLIRIHATIVSTEDPGMRRSPGFNGLFKPKSPILGMIVSGQVEAAGRAVKRFKPGDEVYGFTGARQLGTYAEYICMPENATLAPKPVNMTHAEAAAVPDGGLTALPFLRDLGKVAPGQKVLVNGASGAVGSAAVQIAIFYGAQVTGVCSAPNLDLVRSLGAQAVIDYTREEFTKNGQAYDVIFDAAGKSSFARCKGSLTENGIYLTTVPAPGALLASLSPDRAVGKRSRFAATGLMPAEKKTRDLLFLTELVEAGRLKAVIDRVYPLEETPAAHRYVEKGHKKGNVVITI
jgi:NADPH:quinone reductase-like Zn-dependent oxidoreductase